ncbi:MAG TPA: hypothetical protein VMF65_08135 [Acidimicrobiales bacterium]|nr:hypothetical protein [Acidimicrobiales bacterium]
MAAPPGAWPAQPAAEIPLAERADQPDLTREDWLGAEQRRLGRPGQPVDLSAPRTERGRAEHAGPAAELTLGVNGAEGAPLASAPARVAAHRRRGWLPLTRLWALLKVGSMAYTTWWAMGYVHAGVGTTVSAYGAVCLFAGFGARWRKRFFGPGQIIEPELYEEVGRWLYRLGVVLVLVGGAAVTAQYVAH